MNFSRGRFITDVLKGTKRYRMIKLLELMHIEYSVLSKYLTGTEQIIGFRARANEMLQKG